MTEIMAAENENVVFIGELEAEPCYRGPGLYFVSVLGSIQAWFVYWRHDQDWFELLHPVTRERACALCRALFEQICLGRSRVLWRSDFDSTDPELMAT